jgi:hypothetical protein
VVARHMSISFSRRNPLFTRASRSSAFILDFFHSLAGLGRGEMLAGMTSEQIPPFYYGTSSYRCQPSKPLDGDGFILQEQGVFTHIRSGATLVASGGGACGLPISRVAVEETLGWKH